MVDRVTSMEVGNTIEGIKCWSITDEYFNEHFPGFPVVPGVLVTESMAQLLGTLVEKSYDEKFPVTIIKKVHSFFNKSINHIHMSS